MVVCGFPRLLVNKSFGNGGGTVLNSHTTASSEITDSTDDEFFQQFSMRVSDINQHAGRFPRSTLVKQRPRVLIIGVISELPMREIPIQKYESW